MVEGGIRTERIRPLINELSEAAGRGEVDIQSVQGGTRKRVVYTQYIHWKYSVYFRKSNQMPRGMIYEIG